MYYSARWYDPQLGLFLSPDTFVPNATNSLDYNRYLYGRGNPIKYNDPTGHQGRNPGCIETEMGNCVEQQGGGASSSEGAEASALEVQPAAKPQTGTGNNAGFVNGIINFFRWLLDFEVTETSTEQPSSISTPIPGLINNTGRTLSENENLIAQKLVSEGKTVEVVAEGKSRQPDFLVNGVATELKTISNITSRDVSGAVASRILEGAGQASNIIIDAQAQVGFTEELAERAIRRAYGADTAALIQQIRIIGNQFDIVVTRRSQ